MSSQSSMMSTHSTSTSQAAISYTTRNHDTQSTTNSGTYSELSDDTKRDDKQFNDSPVLPKRQARMALNVIKGRRKDGVLPSLPTQPSKSNGKNEKTSQGSNNSSNIHNIIPGNAHHAISANQAMNSPRLPPPNKRKTSILKDGVGSKTGDNKNVIINEVTNIKHHYDPLEKVRADKKKLEQALLNNNLDKKTVKMEGE